MTYQYNNASWAGWATWLVALAGIWLLASPFALGVNVTTAAFWSFVLMGVAVFYLGIAAAVTGFAWPGWASALLGAWLVVSPWALGFTDDGAAASNGIITGVVVVVLSLGYLAQEQGWFAARSRREPNCRQLGTC